MSSVDTVVICQTGVHGTARHVRMSRCHACQHDQMSVPSQKNRQIFEPSHAEGAKVAVQTVKGGEVE